MDKQEKLGKTGCYLYEFIKRLLLYQIALDLKMWGAHYPIAISQNPVDHAYGGQRKDSMVKNIFFVEKVPWEES
ncbi:MAG: hypothetical protein Ct9H300mP23_08850 [Nitrospinota bacterium]|nr:MAG: hypothetical protein Ct9H300mP23_08850 [Nitrospinota bacterium]